MTLDKDDIFRQATIFRQGTMSICGSLDIEKALWRLYRYIETLMPVAGINLHLFESGLHTLRTIAQVTRDETGRMNQTVSLPDEITTELENGWLEKKDVRICNQPELDPLMRAMTRLFGHPERSIMVMRLEIEGNRIGALTLFAEGKNQYKEEDARLIAMLHDPIAIAMSNAVKHQEVLKLKDMLVDENRYLHKELLRISGDEIIGADKGLKQVMEMVRKVAPLDSPVLLLGETGVGKEVIANAIHYASARKNGLFVKVNCGAIPETLMDSELFGHEKGAFTGASVQKRGRFERAHRGTILLDEIGELPLQAQVRLLRVLQNKEIDRLGGTMPIPVDARVIAATHQDLKDMVLSGQFREDLWFRLNVFPIWIPPLRERREDIPALVHHFIEKKTEELNFSGRPTLAPRTLERLNAYHWPGNVRELENVIERALIDNRGQSRIKGPLVMDHLDFPQKKEFTPFLKDSTEDIPTLDELTAKYIRKILNQTKGRIEGCGGAAELLGIHPSTLRGRMRKLGVPYQRRSQSVGSPSEAGR